MKPVLEVSSCRSRRQLAVLDSLYSEDALSEQPNLIAASTQDNDLQAIMGVEMNVHRGDDVLVMGMLDMVELVLEIRGMVIKDDGQRPDDLLEGVLPLLIDESVPYQVAYHL